MILNFGLQLLDFLRDLSYRNVNFNAYGVIALNGSLLQTVTTTYNY